MKVSANNQSLILRGESLEADRLFNQASKLIPNPTALQRVRILEARAESAVFQADYYAGTHLVGAATLELDPAAELDAAVQLDAAALDRRSANIASSRSPLEQYIRIQSGLDEIPKAAFLDVLA